MADFPYLPLWTDAYLADTQHLTNEEHGVYLRLLMVAWRSPDCSLPNDDKRLRTIVSMSADEWASIRDEIMGFFTVDGDQIYQKRLVQERHIREARRDAGSKGGSKTQANPQANPQAKLKHARSRESQSQSHIPESRDSESRAIPESGDSDSHGNGVDSCAELASLPSAPSPVVVRLPLAGKDNPEAEIRQHQADEWSEAYPGVDIEQQLRNMRQWLLHSPKRRKTARGIGRFVTTWLSKEQDRGGGAKAAPYRGRASPEENERHTRESAYQAWQEISAEKGQ